MSFEGHPRSFGDWVAVTPWLYAQVLMFWRKGLVDAAILEAMHDITVVTLVRQRQRGRI